MVNDTKSEREERVNTEYKKWEEKYEIPFNKVFKVKTLLKLQDELDSLSYNSGMVKTRKDLICMIAEMDRGLDFPKKNKHVYNKNIFIVCEKYKENMANLLEVLINPNDIKLKRKSKNSFSIEKKDGTCIEIIEEKDREEKWKGKILNSDIFFI